ncbi:flavin reductase family protein [Faunimonas sp. B44]|uniref:flavin reductase family protein n=1 Tax=Faunimonas sp. B44 TaxID=3461493 RepID=UPI004044D77F
MNQHVQPADLRQALGRFATGVAVVTTLTRDGTPIGMTINSFSSVSLEPPLVLWSLSRRSSRFADFVAADRFAINVLGAGQEAVSSRFAGPSARRFEGLEWAPGKGGVPLIAGSIAAFECSHAEHVPAGDHLILLGRVERFEHRPGEPLVFFASRYGLPRQAA